MNVNAIIWDYDGTLVDTLRKNLNVTRNIIKNVIAKDAEEFAVLRSLENYYLANRRNTNWRELYRREFNLAEKQIDEVGRLWTDYQLKDNTEVSCYEGIKAVIGELAEFPQGIVSQNSKNSITRNLAKMNLLSYFKYVVGYEEVDIKNQKPAPDGLISCMNKLSAMESGYVCYIGDHETDAQCVRAANRALQNKNVRVKVYSIAASYDTGADTSTWSVRPDFEARKVEDIVEIVAHIGHPDGRII